MSDPLFGLHGLCYGFYGSDPTGLSGFVSGKCTLHLTVISMGLKGAHLRVGNVKGVLLLICIMLIMLSARATRAEFQFIVELVMACECTLVEVHQAYDCGC